MDDHEIVFHIPSANAFITEAPILYINSLSPCVRLCVTVDAEKSDGKKIR